MESYDDTSFEESRVSESGTLPSPEPPFVVERVPRKLPPLYAELFAPKPGETVPVKDPATVDAETVELFKGIMAKRLKEREEANPSFVAIPRFFFRKKAGMEPSLLSRVQREANRLHLVKLSQQALTDEHLKTILDLLQSHQTPPKDGSERINYDDFCVVRDKVREVTPLASDFFTATTFLKCPRDELDRISIRFLFQYICGSVGLRQTRVRLSSYDEVGDGYLREFDLESYINDLIPTFANLRTLQDNFKQFYVFTAVRKFMYFLDPKKTGRIAIRDIISSKVMAELLSLQTEGHSNTAGGGGGATVATTPTSSSGGKPGGNNPAQNWFSAANALRVYGQYLDLDTDLNGMLSKSELAQYAGGTFTNIFFDRVFQECLTYGGEMDFKVYLDFVLTMENRATPEAMAFMFRIVDIHGRGYLDARTIQLFFREVTAKLVSVGHDPVNSADVQDEIFDMVRPADPLKITLEELKASKQGHTILFMLVDCNAFYQYDNRESLMQQREEEEAASGGMSSPS